MVPSYTILILESSLGTGKYEVSKMTGPEKMYFLDLTVLNIVLMDSHSAGSVSLR